MIIAKRHIEKDLKRLQSLYLKTMSGSDPDIPIYFSKLGVLELTGWVEGSFDMIARRAVKGRIKHNRFHKFVENAIERNWGFSYEKNFLVMMAKIIGLPECERLEQYLDSDGSLSRLEGELSTLLNQRRVAAHVNLAQTTVGFDSPSVSLRRLQVIHPIMRDIYAWFCS